MRVLVCGGTGVLGRASVPALLADGHDVWVTARSQDNEQTIARLGARPAPVRLDDTAALTAAVAEVDAVVNLCSHVPVGYAGLRRGAWRAHDDLLTDGVSAIVTAARAAGCRRLVHASVSALYADAGDDWVTEASPLHITPETDPAAMGEAYVGGFDADSRDGVVLRLGLLVGDDGQTRHWLRAAGHGRPIGIGRPEGWAHVLHAQDAGTAIAAALHTPGGVYNVGARPVPRRELVDGFARAAGAEQGEFLGPVLRRLAGARAEPWARSLRVCGDHFAAHSGWRPTRPEFDDSWFDVVSSRVAHLVER